MPTETRSPTANELGNTTGWTNPSNAHVSDNQYASCPTYGVCKTNYKNYGFNIPAGSTINSVKVKVEHYEGADDVIQVEVSWDGGITWGPLHEVPLRTVEGIDAIDVTGDTAWTPAKLSDANFKVHSYGWTGGACFAENMEFPLYPKDGDLSKLPEFIPIQDLRVGDVIIGWDEKTFNFCSSKVLENTRHVGDFTVHHLISGVPSELENVTIERARALRHREDIKELVKELEEKYSQTYPKYKYFKDQLLTGDHPIPTLEKGDVQVADLVPAYIRDSDKQIIFGDYLWGCFGPVIKTRPIPLLEIRLRKVSVVYDLQCETKYFFKHYGMVVEGK